MLKILKASAGSGKTYALAREYISLVLKSGQKDAYRHILAVTFTNKATDEMKRRILRELYTLSTEPEKSPYYNDLIKEIGAEVIRQRAKEQMGGILYDYSAFAVSTIDRFFQQTLRAFAREIGRFSSYQVQLDREALIRESVDRVLDNITEEDRGLLDWLTESARWDLQQKGSFSVEGRLFGMAKSLGTLGQDLSALLSRDRLKELAGYCAAVQKDFEKDVALKADAVIKAVEGAGLRLEDFSNKFLCPIRNFLKPAKGKTIKGPTEAFLRKASDPEAWFPKARAGLLAEVQVTLGGPMDAFIGLWDTPYKVYLTAGIIGSQTYSLGMAQELSEAFQQIQKEQNVISIDDSNLILKNIIDSSDTPFVYEKIGVRFDHFLLDEFQDTSDVQWENFRPLLHGSIDTGNMSLVVGDVKQSIYRWRGSDWNLLGERLEGEFSNPEITVLDGNYRTCREIVQFNNEFFTFASETLGLKDIYRDVRQEPRTKDPAPGSVEVVFTQEQTGEILATVTDILERGGRYSDIAVLVRDNSEGGAVASFLLENGVPVVSDDSLFVKASVTVRRLVSQLSLVENPPSEGDRPSVEGFLASATGFTLPEHYHSLVDLAEALLRNMSEADAELFAAEVPYIQSFMDYLQDWVQVYGNNLGTFLKAWKEADPKIASPRSGNSVRVMTIHKSKGLEFPFVIFPFAEKVTLYKHSKTWCSPKTDGTPMSGKAEGLYYVDLTDSTAVTLFGEDYLAERRRQTIDNLNVFYVALTRPKCGLKVIAAPPPAKRTEYSNLSQVLYDFCGSDEYRRGEPYDFSALEWVADGIGTVETGYPSFPADAGQRLRFSPEAADYFGPDGSVGPDASNRIRGNVLHEIMSGVVVPEDLAAAVDAAVASGELPASQRDATLEGLGGRIASVAERGWFSPSAQILSEAPVLAPGGAEYRPDRVVIHPDGTVDVIDYKFGARQESYHRQVARYMNLYRRMGYASVRGFLWYLEENAVEPVV